ncbi:creatininase family protein [Aureimonas populi]|uniref:Creatininase family protein n=1 Tax=Aureimonas populi TaxID=1701758 RepID=A0ABW5CQF1_9HYPH|nr:creatininase family protein [Aureimonas populi]
MTRRIHWADFATTEFEGLDPMETIAVLPVAAIEQHGPHLGTGTDFLINSGMVAMLAERLPGDMDVRVLPVQPVGKSNEHLHARGTLTISAATLVAHWTDLGLSVARAGIRKLVIVNSHGGNEEVIGIVARELRVRAGLLVVKSSWSRFGKPEGLFGERENRYGIHAGDAETSLMLHFRPQAVRMQEARDFASTVEEDEAAFTHLRATGPHAYAWVASDLNPAGAVGEAQLASAAKGAALAAHQVDGFIELLRDVRRKAVPAAVPAL